MSKFHIGQRVKLIHGDPSYINREGFVVSLGISNCPYPLHKTFLFRMVMHLNGSENACEIRVLFDGDTECTCGVEDDLVPINDLKDFLPAREKETEPVL